MGSETGMVLVVKSNDNNFVYTITTLTSYISFVYE